MHNDRCGSPPGQRLSCPFQSIHLHEQLEPRADIDQGIAEQGDVGTADEAARRQIPIQDEGTAPVGAGAHNAVTEEQSTSLDPTRLIGQRRDQHLRVRR